MSDFKYFLLCALVGSFLIGGLSALGWTLLGVASGYAITWFIEGDKTEKKKK